MLSGIQPQYILPVGHLATVWNTLRSASHGGTLSRVPRPPQQTASLSTAEPVTLNEANSAVTGSLEALGLEHLAASVRLETLSPMLDTKLEGPATDWGESHVSAQSFFQNKYGLSEAELLHSTLGEQRFQHFRVTLPNLAQTTAHFLRPGGAFPQQQSRGFKTKRAGRTSGMGSMRRPAEAADDQFSAIKYLRQSMFEKVGSPAKKNSHKFKSLLAEHEHSPDLQEKMKIAFAEGYSAHERKDGSGGEGGAGGTWLRRGLRVVWYGLLVWLAYQLLQGYTAFGGTDVKINVLKGDRYEIHPEDISVRFEDVKGVDEAKQELQDVVEFLRDPEKFKALGAKLPKGVLLVGSPGIGKTLLARAVAGEAEVPFFHASGSEFDEVFVGTGAKRVRQLFDAAKLRAPCVIFIDEIDTVGAKRTSSQIHPYANQTINQLLSEMDGFQQNEGVIVLGATNRRDNLDKALLRPGRFDVEVRVFPPDVKGRKDILDLYLRKIKVGGDVDTLRMAKGTTGCTGADLENLVNQAALKAAKDGAPLVTMAHMEFARDKVLMGPAKKTRIQDEETNQCTAHHEAGHTLVAYYTRDSTPLHKVTIVPRGTSLGHTSFVPEKEHYNYTRSQLLAQMDVAMGGRVAEELVYGHDRVTTGASSDFSTATAIATAMVKRYGMSEKVGVRVVSDEEVESGMSFLKVNELSAATSELIDSEIKRLLQESYERARAILKTHASEHRALATALLKYETLDADDIRAIVEGKKLTSKAPKPAPPAAAAGQTGAKVPLSIS